MYLYKQNRKDGDTYLAIKEKYYIPKKGTRERTVEKIGLLSELKKQYEDPVAHFTRYAKQLTEERNAEKHQTIEINKDEKLEAGTNDTRNVGYGIYKILYKNLELDKFWNWKTRGKRTKFSTDHIFRLLTFSRALNPGSKKYTLENKDFFFEPFDGFSLDDIYHALDIIAENQEDLQKWIFEHSKKICERDISTSYFDCTNYYFDISHPDMDELDDNGNPVDSNGNSVPAKYRKRGPEKNRRPDPIVEMGLMMDANGIPVAFDLFPGNESEKLHMSPIIERIKRDYDDCRIIYVADRGLNTSDNIYWLNGDNRSDVNKRDGYVYGQTVRGADAEFKKWVLSGGFITEIVDDDGEKIAFKHKSRIYPKELHVNVTKPGSRKPVKRTVKVDQKQMVYYSEKYARMQKTERDIMIARACDLIEHPKKYDHTTSKGSASYVKNIAFDKTTGEIIEGRNLELDIEKIREEELYDGYYAIVTSELSMSDSEMRRVYRGLTKIEDSFKITKAIFESRPVFVRTNEHIDAHFATCFLALVLERILEHKLGHKFPTKRIIDSIRKYNCTHLDINNWQFTYYDEILDACGEALDLDLKNKYRTQQEIQRLLHY